VSRFVDEARIFVKAGAGGNGCTSFRREKYVPRGGPDGGTGGRGGSVYLEADPALFTLYDLQYRRHYKAERGAHGQGDNKHGKSAEDLVIKVPCGTLVYRDQALLADLVKCGQRVEVARGGQGGKGNTAFADATHRAPRFAERGQPGEEGWIDLELKLMADIGLVGLPNAGKSTLLSALTAARPRIAPYPFTTLSPHLGVMVMAGERPVVIADLPGLIEGAHHGAGLGLRFLRHAERTRVLALVVDLAGSGPEQPVLALATVRGELEAWRPELLKRSSLIIGTKLDLAEAEAGREALREALQDEAEKLVTVSAPAGLGLELLLERLSGILNELGPPEAPEEEIIPVVSLPAQERLVVKRDGEVFRVSSRRVDKAVQMTDLDNPEALAHLRRRLRALGMDQALQEAGAKEGDTVIVAGQEFTFIPDLV